MTTTEVVAVVGMGCTLITCLTAVVMVTWKAQDRALKMDRRVTILETISENTVKLLKENNAALLGIIKNKQD